MSSTRFPPRLTAFLLLAAAAAALFVRLGFWQLNRLAERRERNALAAAQLAEAPHPIGDLLTTNADLRYRRASATGTFDYEHELVLAARTNAGSPGVNLVTPLRIAGEPRALLVNRGWVYSPNGATVDRRRWREADTASVSGYLDALATGDPPQFRAVSDSHVVRRLLRDSLVKALPYPIADYVLIATSPPRVVADSVPVRVTAPLLDEGPHRGYALQWFTFAAIAVIGAGVVVARGNRA